MGLIVTTALTLFINKILRSVAGVLSLTKYPSLAERKKMGREGSVNFYCYGFCSFN